MPRVKKVARRRRDLKKRGPSGVENIEYPSFSDPPIIVGDDYEFTYFSPERNVRSPEQFSSEGAPIHILSKELGLPEVSKDDQSGLPHGAKSSPPLYMPKIFLGDASPAPRWLIRAVDSEADQGPVPRQSSISGGSRLPPLGRLRWEFDSGSSDKHGLDEAWLCDYAYQYLVNSLGDPIVRDQMRDLIWNGPHAPTVAHVEDPLPIPPPPPHFKEKKTLDYVTLQPPISATAPDDYYFMYPGYSRPPLATRPWKKRATDTNAESAARESDSYVTATTEFSPCSSGDHNHGYESRSGSVCRAKSGISANARTRASTSSSMSISPQDSKHTSGQDSDSPGYHPSSDDDDRHVSSGEYKWVWFLLTILILGMFLCLFFYAFGILR
ncbi:uncharacterized protein BJX67DRAFT_380171 [Aspergillus lucknowensis]|uniref:Uncharacterized protein n=1 Tax=Aspergillus lucknowensis TaxID=176173 RepID=A0ABR4LVE3_9EURO